jgi:hypothetical protein
MQKFTLLFLFVFFNVISLATFGQAPTGKIYFIRATGYVGSAVNFKAYIDDGLVCKLKNKTYSVHIVNVGKHTVSASNTGLSNQKKSKAFEVSVEEGKTTYVDVAWANDVLCQEITEKSAEVKLKGLKQNTKCGAAD